MYVSLLVKLYGDVASDALQYQRNVTKEGMNGYETGWYIPLSYIFGWMVLYNLSW